VAALWYTQHLAQWGRTQRFEREETGRYVAALAGGVLTAAAGLLWPELLGATALASHLGAHAVLGLVAPPLLLMGIPRKLAWEFVPTRRRARLVRLLTNPIVAAVLFETFLLVTHTPYFYALVVEHTAAHIAEHALLLGLGLLFWWPVVEPLPVWGQYGWLWKIAYLFFSRMPIFGLGIALLFATTVLYSPEMIQAGNGLSPVREQQLAGAVLVFITNIVLFVALTVIVLPRLTAAARE